jgi:hypothetical protein
MSALRESVSLEAIERAIRARLAAAYGAESPYVVLPLPIHPIPVSDDGVNWELILDPEVAPAEGIDAARSAAATVASNFNISTYH